MSEPLPTFRYHPDPVATGSVVASPKACERCGVARGFVYTGPTFAVEEVELLCPWCIADGSAAREYDAQFTTCDGAPAAVPRPVLEEVERRTPGFSGWQQEHWMFHCSDGAQFLGRAGWDELAALPGARESLLADGWAEDVLPFISVDGDLTGYLFRCRHCGTALAYADAS